MDAILHIQKFLRQFNPSSAINHAQEKFELDITQADELFQFNYNIKSPRGVPEAEECRGLILEKPSWDIVAYPFYRFYNIGDVYAAKPDLSKSVLWEKLDGTLIMVYWYNNKWNAATRGKIFAEGNVGENNQTFSQLFFETLGDRIKYFDEYHMAGYLFELTGPKNRVVTPYEKPEIHLLGMRMKDDDWGEFGMELCGGKNPEPMLEIHSKDLRIPLPKRYKFSNMNHVYNMMKMFTNLEEGYVLTDYSQKINGNFSRVKIKSDVYLTVSRIMGHLSDKHLVDAIIFGGKEEIEKYVPDFIPKIKKMEDRIKRFAHRYNEVLSECLAQPDRKAVANVARKTSSPGVLFYAMDHNCSIMEATASWLMSSDVKSNKRIEKFTEQLLNEFEE